MLDNMRTASSSFAGKLVMGLLFALLSIAFGISFGPGSRGCEGLRSGVDYAAKVNGEIISRPEFERYYYRRIRQFGDLDRRVVEQYLPRSRVLDELVKDRLVAEEARSQGVGVADEELRDVIWKDPSFQEEGKFSKERYQLVLERSLGMTTETFETELRRDLSIGKMGAVIRETAKVTDWQLEQKFREENEKVDVAFVRFAPAFYASVATASDAEVAALEKAHPEQLSAEYEKEANRFHLPRRVQARHLLIKVAPGEDDAKAKDKVQAARAEIDQGKDFGDVAKKLSQAGDAALGGEIGQIHENDHLFDPSIEKAALALDAGKLSPPIRTAQGYELVQVEKVLPAEDKSLDQVKGQIAKDLVVREKEAALAKAAAIDAQKKVAAGTPIDKLFQPAEPPAEGAPHKFSPPPDHPVADSSGAFTRSAVGYVPKVGQSAPLQQAAFQLASPGTTTPGPFQVADAWVVIQLVSHEKPDLAEFAKKKEELRESAVRTAEVQLMESWRTKLRQQAVVEINPAVVAPPQAPQS